MANEGFGGDRNERYGFRGIDSALEGSSELWRDRTIRLTRSLQARVPTGRRVGDEVLRCGVVGDGVEWRMPAGLGQYTLTRTTDSR